MTSVPQNRAGTLVLRLVFSSRFNPYLGELFPREASVHEHHLPTALFCPWPGLLSLRAVLHQHSDQLSGLLQFCG